MTKPELIPWAAMIGAAARLGVTPEHFWRLSVREWRALCAPAPGECLPRSDFLALARDFPDET